MDTPEQGSSSTIQQNSGAPPLIPNRHWFLAGGETTISIRRCVRYIAANLNAATEQITKDVATAVAHKTEYNEVLELVTPGGYIYVDRFTDVKKLFCVIEEALGRLSSST
jgi:hypothetical protein